MFDVITIGSATLDIFLRSYQFTIDRHERGVYLCERYEGKIEAQELVMVSGGGATNSAVSFARKGINVAPIVEVGADPAAAAILAELSKDNLDLSLIIEEPDEVTAVSVILLAAATPATSADRLARWAGGNSIVTYRGASRMLTVADIPFERLDEILKPDGWVYMTSVGGDMEVVERVIGWARETGRNVFWNPGESEIRQIRNSKFEIRNFPDVLQLNRQEASEFLGIDYTDESVWRGEHCPTSPDMTLVITDGDRGGRVCHQGICHWYDGIRTTLVDSTGAGDAFGSGFVAALILGQTLDTAIEWGRRQAARVVEQIGAKKGLLTLEQLQ